MMIRGLPFVWLTLAACSPKPSPGPGPATPVVETPPTPPTPPAPPAAPPAPPAPPPSPPEPTLAEPARLADAPPVAGTIAVPGPLMMLAARPDGRAIVVCQARRDSDGDGRVDTRHLSPGGLFGDELAPYLIIGAGAGQELDVLHAVDPGARRLVATSAGALVLIDTGSGASTRLGSPPAGSDPASPYTGHAVASFDRGGKRLLYLRAGGRDGGPALILRDLDRGTETPIAWGKGRLWQAGLDAGGEWIEVEVAVTPPPVKHKPGWIEPVEFGERSGGEASDPKVTRRCGYGGVDVDTWLRKGEKIERRFARVGSRAPAADIPGLVDLAGAAVIRRRADRALTLAAGPGPATVLVPADCGAAVIDVHAPTLSVLVACTAKGATGTDPPNRYPLVLYDRKGAHPLDVDVEVDTGPDADPTYERALLGSYRARDARYESIVDRGDHLIDLATGKRLASDGGDLIVQAPGRVLVEEPEAKRHSVVDVSGGRRRHLEVAIDRYGDEVVTGTWAALEGEDSARSPVVDLVSGAVVGTVDGVPLAISEGGHVLVHVAGRRFGAVTGLAAGPLAWVRPAPLTAPGD